ncbi:MAG: hypothetical protein WCO10_01325 [bacterium]
MKKIGINVPCNKASGLWSAIILMAMSVVTPLFWVGLFWATAWLSKQLLYYGCVSESVWIEWSMKGLIIGLFGTEIFLLGANIKGSEMWRRFKLLFQKQAQADNGFRRWKSSL